MTKSLKFEEIPPPKVATHPNSCPSDGFALLVDGRFKTHFGSQEEAEAAAMALKARFPLLQIMVRDAVTGERCLVELPIP